MIVKSRQAKQDSNGNNGHQDDRIPDVWRRDGVVLVHGDDITSDVLKQLHSVLQSRGARRILSVVPEGGISPLRQLQAFCDTIRVGNVVVIFSSRMRITDQILALFHYAKALQKDRRLHIVPVILPCAKVSRVPQLLAACAPLKLNELHPETIAEQVRV